MDRRFDHPRSLAAVCVVVAASNGPRNKLKYAHITYINAEK
jgi:hypothetical protein